MLASSSAVLIGAPSRYGFRMADARIAADDPRASDIRALLARHLVFAHEHSPPEDVHALDLDGLLDANFSFFSCRLDGRLLGRRERPRNRSRLL
jgi:hypothetical protein